jgi:ComF family protein
MNNAFSMHILDLLFPKFCVSCGSVGSYICAFCQKTIKPILEPVCPVCERPAIKGKTHTYCQGKYTLEGLISFFAYQGVIQKAIKHVKYRFASDMATTLISLAIKSQNIIERYPALQGATVIPIPLHPSRYRFRGFNQAALFGKQLANAYNLEYAQDIIKRTVVSPPQVEMKTKKERIENIKDVFEVNNRVVIPPVILLVDDVFTTGATMREAGKVLKLHGAQQVWAVTVAR